MSRNRLGRIAVATCATLVLSSCATTLVGQPVSVFDDPYHVAGMEANDGPTGFRDDAPESDRDVENSDGGDIDTGSAMTISDLEDYWREHYSEISDDEFEPAETLISWDSTDRDQPNVCGEYVYDQPNAMYCFDEDTIAWDRGDFMLNREKYFGAIGFPAVLAHEYGHVIQYKSDLIDENDSTLLFEQQADCFEGAYMRWVAEGNSSRFTLSTGDGLNKVLAELVSSRDPVFTEEEREDVVDSQGEHGSAFDRISAFQIGFTDGPTGCAAIDEDEIDERRGDMPVALPEDTSGEWPVTDESVEVFVDALNSLFAPENPPVLSLDPDDNASCPDARATEPVSYCPATNTVAVDVPGLAAAGETSTRRANSVVFGDNTAYSMLASRYMLVVQNERGVPLDDADASLRTSCLTGVANALMFDGVSGRDGNTFSLTAGDLDEAVSGILTNGLAASDVNGRGVPSGFSRIDAFRAGVLNADVETCFKKFS